MKFTHLHLHTHYSLLDGLTRPSFLIKKIKDNNMDAVAITDHGNMYGVIEFYKECKKHKIKPIIGVEAYICNNHLERTLNSNPTYHLTLIAENNTGYNNLMALVSESYMNGFYYKPRIDFELLKKYCTGVICLSGCLGGELSQLLLADRYKDAKNLAQKYQTLFGNRYYIEVQRHRTPEQQKVTPLVIQLAKEMNIPIVATCDSHYLNLEDKNKHEILLAVQTGKKLTDKNRMSLCEFNLHVATSEEVKKNFQDIPEALANTSIIANRCNVEIVLGKTRLPYYKLYYKKTYDKELRFLCEQAMNRLFPDDQKYIDRMNYELSVISQTGFASYLLILQDIVSWGRRQNIAIGPGRGSAAGCLLSYLLGITKIDPIKYGLYFERFMNPERVSPPDIDIDIEDKRREEVIQYIVKTYGQDHVAQIITFGKMFARTSIRDVGRVLGIDHRICDTIAKCIPFQAVRVSEHQIQDLLDNSSEFQNLYGQNKELIDISNQLEGTIRHSGVHASAIVISDQKINEYMPIQFSKDKRVVSQFDMYRIEDLGLLKMDMLGLRNLSVISECQNLVKKQLGYTIDIDNIPLNDEKTFKLLQQGKTTSIFQLESPGMKKNLVQLKPTDLNDIAAMVALYRPGPMGLIENYINRKHGKESIEYLHPKLASILQNTYGIMVYQEQLMAAVRELAGFTLAQADIFRKAVGKKIKSLLEEQEIKFKEGCDKVGTPKLIANKFWALVIPFSGYAFNLAHAVSYAMIAYQTAYLKANYPIQFMLAEINSVDDSERLGELIRELKSMGMHVVSADVNQSDKKFINLGVKIVAPISSIKGLGTKVGELIVQNRGKEYLTLQDFVIKNNDKIINKKTIQLLSECGSLDSLLSQQVTREDIITSADIISHYARFEDKDILIPLSVLQYR